MIGVFTIHAVPNYGAMLQAHALSSWLCEEGFPAEVIDYRQPALEQYFKFKWTIPPKFRHWLRLRACNKFLESHIKLGKEKISSESDFRKVLSKYDAFITGSDQVWFTGAVQYYDPLYFLDFPAPSRRKVSYAASVGGTTDFGPFGERVRKAVNEIDHIGVRDQHTASLIAPLTRKSITQTVDPVFLYDFKDLLKGSRPMTQPYILVFGDFRGESRKVINQVKRVTGIGNVVTLQYPQQDATLRVASPGPKDWLNWFAHADFVITSYFHGTVAALKFRRPFISVPTPGRRLKVQTLLAPLGLSERCLVHGASEGGLELCDSGTIDWKTAGSVLESKISASKMFLRSALS